MIRIIINKDIITLNQIWYHYKNVSVSNSQLKYEMILNKDADVIKIIESYSGCIISDSKLISKVVKKDEETRSMGLLWLLLNHLKAKYLYEDDKNWNWVLNNINF